jgi:hypothetical protein
LAALVLVALSVSVVSALVLRQSDPITAPGRALGLSLRWVVPLTAFAFCALCTGRARLDDCVWPIAMHGIPKRHVALGVISVAAIGSAAIAALAGSVAIALAYGASPGWLADLTTSSWICALGGGAYAGWFMLGAGFLRLGRGRWGPLVADFTLGATTSVFALPWPRAHLVNLAGGEPVLGLGQPTSSVVLSALAVSLVCLAAMRAGD